MRIDPASFHGKHPCLAPIVEMPRVEDNDDSIPDLMAHSVITESPIEYNTLSPPYVPRSPSFPLNANAPIYVPRSPPPSTTRQSQSDRIPEMLKQVNERLGSLENSNAATSTHLSDPRGHADFVQGHINELRTGTSTLTADLRGHVVSTQGAMSEIRNATDRIWKEVDMGKTQIGELIWMYERVNADAQFTQDLSLKVENLARSVEANRSRRPKADYFLNGFKKETRVKIEALTAENVRIGRVLTTQGKRDAQVLREIDELRKIQGIDCHDWIHEVTALRKISTVDLNERIGAIERFLTSVVNPLTQQQAPYPIHPSTNNHARPPMPPISANTVQQVLSALMSTPQPFNRPVPCAV